VGNARVGDGGSRVICGGCKIECEVGGVGVLGGVGEGIPNVGEGFGTVDVGGGGVGESPPVVAVGTCTVFVEVGLACVGFGVTVDTFGT
jgi:hypothetical protein